MIIPKLRGKYYYVTKSSTTPDVRAEACKAANVTNDSK